MASTNRGDPNVSASVAGTEPTEADEAQGPTDQLLADVFARACPSRTVLENVTGKWGVLALAALAEGSHRFNALRRRVDGVSEKMLAQTLQSLERDGMVVRDVRATIPPHVEYSLTPLGGRIAAMLTELIELIESEIPTVMDARQRYARAHGDG